MSLLTHIYIYIRIFSFVYFFSICSGFAFWRDNIRIGLGIETAKWLKQWLVLHEKLAPAEVPNANVSSLYARYGPDVRDGGGVSAKRTMLDRGGPKSKFLSDVFDG